MDIIIRDVEEINGQYKIYNKDGTGGHWYISKESAEQLSNQVERVVSLASDSKEAVQTAEKVEIPIKSIAFSRQQHIGKAFRHLYEACLNKTDLRGFIEKEEPIIAPLHETDATGQMMYADLEKFVSKWMED